MAIVADSYDMVVCGVYNNYMKAGDDVAWRWGNGLAEGRVMSVHHEPTTIQSKGKTIKRNGTADNPALIIEHTSGNNVLKRSSEVQKTIHG